MIDICSVRLSSTFVVFTCCVVLVLTVSVVIIQMDADLCKILVAKFTELNLCKLAVVVRKAMAKEKEKCYTKRSHHPKCRRRLKFE
ncbi:ORF97 [Betabaculovirus altermyunipunctae]|uniref:ORF97 n=1 Tax=Betabaculovirus altermyunipunctae TaxID=3051996 RepID=A0A1S5YE97_9BBAC|nr:ORF97 [Betabaculovirus altermyunipunctae]AQQ80364.1 ORF97 [Betabaculovirus altermyunipunctae]